MLFQSACLKHSRPPSSFLEEEGRPGAAKLLSLSGGFTPCRSASELGHLQGGNVHEVIEEKKKAIKEHRSRKQEEHEENE